MSSDLFAGTDNNVRIKEGSFYKEVLEKRQRPEYDPTSGEPIGTKQAVESKPEPKKAYTTYSDKEVLKAATDYFGRDSLAGSVWMNKYALKNSAGKLYERTPDDMHWRLAREIARIEKKYPNPMKEEEIYELLRDFKYIVPQGSPMAGIGNDFQISSLSNCFVIGEDENSDSYGAILKVDQEQVQLMKRRGGVGHDLSHIRPTESPVKNSALTSTGIVPFMERYSNSTREVAQGGRRGALMLSISIKHPDAEEFIDAKMQKGKVTGANVSVRVTHDFMDAAINGKPFVQQFPINSDNPVVTKEIDAKPLWEKIIHNAWAAAEPGILFWDTVIGESVPDCYTDHGFKTLSTNPCGEIPLCAYDSCRLLAINLFSYVENPFKENSSFNSELFSEHARYAQRIMDDIIDLEVEKVDGILAKIDSDPEDEDTKRTERRLWENIRKKCIQGRRTGIGITAEGDMLAGLGLRYGSEEAIRFSTEVHKHLALEVYASSVDLAEERGAFPVYDTEKEKDNPFIGRIREAAPNVYEKMKKVGRRNIAMLTIAPTGSVSICTQTTSGIEPVFSVSYKRRRKVNPNDRNVNVTFEDEVGDSWEEYRVFHHKFTDWLRVNNYDVEEVSRMEDEELQKIIAKSPYHKATANDIDWVSKVKMQGSIQKWVDHSISVTVNIPEETPEEMVSDIYETAWRSGCKGMTIYREGSRSGVLVTEKKKQKPENEFRETNAPPRPRVLEAEVVRFQNNHEKWVAVVGLLNNKPYEIFTGNAEGFFLPTWVKRGWVMKNKMPGKKTNYDFQFEDRDGYKITMEGLSRQFNKEFWNYAKLISGILRHGMPLPFVVDLIQNLTLEQEHINTWKAGVVRALKKYIPDGTTDKHNKCPKCSSELVYQEGCLNCKNCDYSKCG
ncbi:MAG: adenosylcobalamin-dependent ribonucleoside-diphosphate reductase [Bacteroidales bacterium]|nr:adenosylcobalamin-dependent ribonucleoside-diphosphate reductase [Bacteroidales bacterium]MCF8343658.1 adenosylcobalamin-dependent ribonucleoside-diphosphate reductase [Bacteroidales bacterium]MCF8351365.1 adenosylcobalamin-dependent ribonucleoside-diphosphate reductase [Bacteroidales bacterium]MCF8377724.1 adenosylcobalamin-dependent ribonucleoside-diphosphate reductase [Bacteroidales bacterium]